MKFLLLLIVLGAKNSSAETALDCDWRVQEITFEHVITIIKAEEKVNTPPSSRVGSIYNPTVIAIREAARQILIEQKKLNNYQISASVVLQIFDKEIKRNSPPSSAVGSIYNPAVLALRAIQRNVINFVCPQINKR